MNKRGEIFKTITVGGKLRRNVFDLSHEKKLSANMADLVPVYWDELVPGDKFRGNTEMVIKLAPMIAPIMHRVNAYIHYFAVPHRLVWSNWQNFITGGTDGKSTPVFPYILVNETNKSAFPVGGLADYFGVPPVADNPVATQPIKVNALPFRAYQLIYNEYYRDQTLTPEVTVGKDVDGESTIGLATLRKRSWEKDYFTSALPFPQRGDDVLIPSDPVYKLPSIAEKAGDVPAAAGAITIGGAGALLDGSGSVLIDNLESLGVTVNDLRTSYTLQKFLEKNARAGARYIEQIMAHFQKRVPDYRLQRPEMIGGGKQTVMISEVLASMESENVAQGRMSGYGVSVGNQSGFKYTADEHCYIIGILSVIPRSCYYQGLPRKLSKLTKFDFYFPEFAHLGEQAIKQQEIFMSTDSDANDNVFGYTPRYAEYKYNQDSVHGEFRTSLEYWHLGRKLDNQVALNAQFVECNPDDRIFAVQDEATQKLWIQVYNNIRAIRPMPIYGTPSW